MLDKQNEKNNAKKTKRKYRTSNTNIDTVKPDVFYLKKSNKLKLLYYQLRIIV